MAVTFGWATNLGSKIIQKLKQEDFDRKLEAYLIEKGPNPAGDQFGRMAWRIKTAKQFVETLQDQYDLTDIITFPKVGLNFKANTGIQFKGDFP